MDSKETLKRSGLSNGSRVPQAPAILSSIGAMSLQGPHLSRQSGMFRVVG